MSDIKVNEAQVEDEPLADESAAEGVDAGIGMEDADEVVGEDAGLDPGEARRIRLRMFLRDLVRMEGRVEAAALLGVAYRTVVRAEESGEITGRMADALELLLGSGGNPRVARLEERVEALEKQVREGFAELRAALSGMTEPRGPVQEGHQGISEVQRETGHSSSVVSLRKNTAFPKRPVDPEVVTEESYPDDPEVYGDAWPLVKEWRELKVGHPVEGSTLSWLSREERLLELELGMLEEHGLTLPPEKQPLRGFGRSRQTNHRWKALYSTQTRLRRRRLLWWLRQKLTFGLWRN